MQPVQGYLCMMVLLQGVGCNLCFVCVSFFIVFKSIKRSMHNVGCIGCVTISTRTGVYEFRSVTCIKGYVRGVFQKYAERFHRMVAIAARLMIFHVKHSWYMLIQYR